MEIVQKCGKKIWRQLINGTHVETMMSFNGQDRDGDDKNHSFGLERDHCQLLPCLLIRVD